MNRNSHPRRAATLVVVIACISLATLLFAAVLRMAVAQRRMLETQAWQSQAAWLAESALDRAAARLAADAGYTGETWRPSPETLPGGAPAAVVIRVQLVPEHAGRRLVKIQADFPDDPHRRARREKQATVEIEAKGPNP